ncbi:MAG: cbb3-type cytochrome c oxidase subunit 3 [Alphaproteobacteria bacterium]|nr:cbb3-type cytochrome c oxidase subunit 3 [Alphaproteobacteria bacterium]
MQYASGFASHHAGVIGLLFFFIFFVAMIAWLFRPGSKEQYKEDAQIPFKDENDE